MKKTDSGLRISPTDLSNYLSCKHLIELERLVLEEKLTRPSPPDPALEARIKRGDEHEAAYVEFLKSKGLSVVNLKGRAVEATIEAMKSGVEVIVQAPLQIGSWSGYADILLKVEGNSKFGNWSYEVQDTKLAQETRAAAILQLCLYTDLLSSLQGSVPLKMYVVKPGEDFLIDPYVYTDFQAYYRLVKKNFEIVINSPPLPTYPEPVAHCQICRWWQECDKKRHADDHLSLVAGMRSLHIDELQNQKINTLEQFANAETLSRPSRGTLESLNKRQSQAKIQLDGRIKKSLIHDYLLPIQKDTGFTLLPEPNEGDVYFDIEGDPFYEGVGLEYLLGYSFRNEKGELVYEKIWSVNKVEEKRAFVKFMSFATERLKRFPNMFFYHFAPYEPSAIKRLTRFHAVCESEVASLLRAEKFIDLHAVFKGSLLASVEVYSLKELEKFTSYIRKVALPDAGAGRRAVEYFLEMNQATLISKEVAKVVEEYNEDDCLATEALHRWLEDLRKKLVEAGNSIERPELTTGEPSEETREIDIRAEALFKGLTEHLPEDRNGWNEIENAKWLLAHQIDYFRREVSSALWEYYRVHKLEADDLWNERKAIAGLQFVEELPKEKGKKTPVHRYKFPPQEIGFDKGSLFEVKGESIGSVDSISAENNTIDIKKTAKTIHIHPFAVHVKDVISSDILQKSLMNLANEIIDAGLDHKWPYAASKDLLMRRMPKMLDESEGAYKIEGESDVDAAIRIALNLNKSVLAIQGPPGTGKTYTGARMIIELFKAGRKIGVTAVSHKVIRNLFDEVIVWSAKLGVKISLGHKPGEGDDFEFDVVRRIGDNTAAVGAINSGIVVGGTAWLWCHDDLDKKLDYLFVDEAGQMSLSQVLAASRSAKNLILLGDPQQLEQPQKGSHPEGSDVAALAYLLGGHQTMPTGMGLFLGVTRRLNPALCRFTSEIFYENLLRPFRGSEQQVILGGTPFDGAGLFYVSVDHHGSQSKSVKEVDKVVEIVGLLLANGKWTDADGKTNPLQINDILIVAPYNAQVSALLERLPGMRIGTVDRFQGQGAPVVIYSMTASSTEDAPRGMSFLFSPNRLNVATSRAKCICILVASPRLLEPECTTIDQMRWANALCRYREMAK
jgi:predicted RecB family nuclease